MQCSEKTSAAERQQDLERPSLSDSLFSPVPLKQNLADQLRSFSLQPVNWQNKFTKFSTLLLTI